MKPTKTDLQPYQNELHAAAVQFRVSTRTIRRWMAEVGLYNPRSGFGPGKLSANKAAEIRYLYRTDQFTQVELAERFQVTQAMICRIVNNLAYPIDLMIAGAAEYKKRPRVP